MTQPEFRETPGPAHEPDPERELRDQRIKEEAERQFLAVVSERDRLRGQVEELRLGYKRLLRAWQLSKVVITERNGPETANLIRQGIETRVERELGAGPPEE